MAGRAAHLSKMWRKLGELLYLDSPTPFRENVYLGCGQHDIKVPKQMLADKQALYKTLHADVVHNKSQGEPIAEDLVKPASGLPCGARPL